MSTGVWILHNVHSPWQIYGGAEFLAHGWNSLHRLSSAIVFALQLLRGMFKNTFWEDLFHSSLPGTEVKCQPVDKLCKNVSRGKLTKTSILGTVCRIRLHWSINTLYRLYLYTVGTQRCAHTPVGSMRKRETHLGVMDPLPPVGNQWAPAGCVPVSSSWWFLMMKPFWIMIHSWSLSTRRRVQGQTDPLHLRENTQWLIRGWLVAH